ncbi:MAG: glycyl radical protein, partial [Oscillospiraceae bacterium]|nr:glycyl radical protein [Oscillospiraceae bacterium]
GGQTEDGIDGTNELSYMFLTTQEHIRLASPQFTMRVYAGTPKELLLRAAEIIKGGGGMPALFGDEAVIKSLENAGVPRDAAVNYAIVGCVEPSVIGAFGRNNGGYINLARIVDFALNNGVDRLTGQQIGIKTGTDFSSFEECRAAVAQQMESFVRLQATENHIIDSIQAEVTPHIFASCIIPDCIKKGKDITSGGARYHWTTPFGVGMATAADSLTAVKRLVFEEKRITLSKLNKVLDNNFDGIEGERIRLMLMNSPKYGNDEMAADEMARYITDKFFFETEKYPTGRGGHLVGGVFTLSSTVPHGWKTGATADGRKAKTPVSDSISPTNGIDHNGPTAVLQSASRLNHGCCSGGNVLNIKFSPSALESSGSLTKFADMVRTYLVDLKGYEVQVNVVSGKMMRAAQKNPNEYKDLIVRMAGYSVRFIELSEEIQNDIITRTEHQAV